MWYFHRWLWILLGFVAFFGSCDNEDESGIVIIVKPEEFVRSAKAGEKILYTVQAYSNDGPVNRLKFTSYDRINGLQTILDSVIGLPRISCTFQYAVPECKDTTDIKLRFEAVNNYGESAAMQRFVKVSGGEVTLIELTGITMYSAASGQPDAYNLEMEQLVNSHTVETDSLLDIYAWQDSTANESVLSKEWRSRTGIQFMRFNSFNYATATQLGIENAYATGVKMNYIRDLQADDIIIFGDDRKAMGIIKLIYIFDEPGYLNDRYIFNLKRIRNTY